MSDTTDQAPNEPAPEEQPKRVKFNKTPAVGPGNEPAAALSVEQATNPDEATVQMAFPKEVVLTDDQHRRVRFPIGVVAVPASLADHWFLAASGVKKLGG